MATLTVNGTANVDFEVEVDIDVEDLVQDALREALPIGFDASEVDIDHVNYNG